MAAKCSITLRPLSTLLRNKEGSFSSVTLKRKPNLALPQDICKIGINECVHVGVCVCPFHNEGKNLNWTHLNGHYSLGFIDAILCFQTFHLLCSSSV